MAESKQEKRLEGQVAIVTGAGRGIGRAEALVLARESARVVVNDLGGNTRGEGGKAEVAQRVVDEIRAAGGEAIANSDSVATMEGAQRIVGAAIETFWPPRHPGQQRRHRAPRRNLGAGRGRLGRNHGGASS